MNFTLLNGGVVLCLDSDGRQSPTLQGLFCDVIDRIKKLDVDSNKWMIAIDGGHKEVTFEEWCANGMQMGSKDLPIKPVDDVLGILRSYPIINESIDE